MIAPHLVVDRSQESCLHVVSPPVKSLTNVLLDNWIDGLVVLTQQGEWLHSNKIGRQICDRIVQECAYDEQLPREIWQTCQILFQKRCRHSPVIAESELVLPCSHELIRIRARWLTQGYQGDPHILIILENQTQSKQNLAISEAIRYQFSPREADVWRLHRIGYTYQEIAEALHIAHNTVKKHMKNSYAKQPFETKNDGLLCNQAS
ncbi:MAG: LuxR C-terminal-related transcriptional regulator [Cyanobacteria bacterium J06642_11]